ncbi:unnamed protein product [Arabidopsis halleri]
MSCLFFSKTESKPILTVLQFSMIYSLDLQVGFLQQIKYIKRKTLIMYS